MTKFILSLLLILIIFPIFVLAQAPGDAPSSLSLQNPLGSATFEELIAKLIDWLLVVTLPIIVLLILYAGFLFMISGVSPDQRKNAVNIVKYALIGYAIMLLAKVLVGVVTGFFL